MPPTVHDFHKVIHVIAGGGRMHIGVAGSRSRAMRSISLAGGCFLFVRAGLRHWIEDQPKRPLSLYIVAIEPGVLGDFEPRDSILVLRESLHGRGMRQALRELLLEQSLQLPERKLLLDSLGASLVARVCREGSSPGQSGQEDLTTSRARLQSYVATLEHGFFEDEALDEVAIRLGMSRRAFTHHFREVTGESRDSYLRRLRVRHACRLLEETNRSVAGIAFECGFNDLSSFYRAFKREMGQAPSAFRGEGRREP